MSKLGNGTFERLRPDPEQPLVEIVSVAARPAVALPGADLRIGDVGSLCLLEEPIEGAWRRASEEEHVSALGPRRKDASAHLTELDAVRRASTEDDLVPVLEEALAAEELDHRALGAGLSA